jgi:hypothetical protein
MPLGTSKPPKQKGQKYERQLDISKAKIKEKDRHDCPSTTD